MKTFHRSKSTLHLVRAPERPWSKARVRVAAAFRACGVRVDPVAAQRRTLGFYRSSAMPWAQALG
jgi:hypothetical protein